jgi:menaquinone-specific isochorismate synthase
VRVRTFDLDEPVDLPSIVPDGKGLLWMRHGEGFVAWGEALRIEPGTGPGRFDDAVRELQAFFATLEPDEAADPAMAFGSFTFDDGIPGSVLIVPEIVVWSSEEDSTVTVIGDKELPDLGLRRGENEAGFKVRYAGSSVPEVEWLDAVARTVKSIQGTDLRKVVLARDIHIWSKSPFDVPRLLGGLGERFPECYTFAVDGFIGSTPELLLGKDGPQIRSLVLAGSAPRGQTADEDDRLGAALLASAKDRDEHLLAVESVTEALQPLCLSLNVSTPKLLKLANVQHISTTVTGFLERKCSALEVVGSLHPTAAVCGTPTAGAMEAIRSTEGLNRGRYAGPVGWVDANGDGEWGIALRCAEIDGTRGRLFAGGGIMAASEPEDELEETRLKFRAMMSVLEA